MGLYDRSSIKIFLIVEFTIVVCLLLTSFTSAGETNHQMDKFVVRDGEIEGFTVIRGPNYYRPESLWNYINGGALPYLDYGVGDVITYTGVMLPDSLEIVVDVYDMADSLGAFGIFSNERFPEYNYLKIGVDGYITENSLCFWKDRYYIKVFTQGDSPSALNPIEQIARTIDNRIKGESGMSQFFSLFPDNGRLARTESYLAKNVLGQEFLSNAFVVSYRRGDEEFQLYLIKASDTSPAEKNFNAYKSFLREYGEMEKEQVSMGDEAFIGKESWYGTMFFIRKGAYILGSVGLSDINIAQSHIRMIMSGLP